MVRNASRWVTLPTLIAGLAAPLSGQSTVPSTAQQRIPYSTVHRWVIPAGGLGRVVVIDPKFANDRALRVLAQQLRKDTGGAENAAVDVFSDPRAAKLRDDYVNDELPPKDDHFVDKHFVASYQRIGASGYEAFTITLKGARGGHTTIRFR